MGLEQRLNFNKACRLILLALLIPLLTFPNEPEKFPGARSSGLSNSTIALNDPWSVFNNQAGLGWQRNYWAGIYHEKRYFLTELSYSSLGGCIPIRNGSFGIGITHFGYSQFSQSRFGISYGMMLTKTISAGVGINYHTVRFAQGYSSSGAVTAEAGIIYQPLGKIVIGAHAFNPTRSALGAKRNLSTTFGLGLAYRPVESLLILVQGDDNTITTPVVRAGIEYSPIKMIIFRVGMASKPISMSFGLGWRAKAIDFDLAFSYHPVLGYTPYISLSYTFGAKSKQQDKSGQ